MDAELFLLVYNFTQKRKIIKWLATKVAMLSEGFFFAVYIVGAAVIFLKNPAELIRFIAIPFFVLCYNTFLRKVVKRVRPFARLGVEPLVEHKPNGSFPSNHAASSAIISFACVLISPHLSVMLLIIAFFTGVSRVCTGLHYPFDVFVGWLIGIITGLIGFIIL